MVKYLVRTGKREVFGLVGGALGRCRYSAVSLITRFDFMAPVTRVITALQCITLNKSITNDCMIPQHSNLLYSSIFFLDLFHFLLNPKARAAISHGHSHKHKDISYSQMYSKRKLILLIPRPELLFSSLLLRTANPNFRKMKIRISHIVSP